MAQPRQRFWVSRSTVSIAARRAVAEFLEPRQYLTTWYVAATGSAAGTGSSTAPFQTIQAAANVAEPGDTVLIHSGTYRETVTPAHSGAPASPITYKPFGDGAVVVDGADPVSGFTATGNGVYQTSQDTWDLGEGNNQVFVTDASNGGTPTMLFEARWPNTLTLDPSNPVFAHASNIVAHTVGFGNYDVATLTDPAHPAGRILGRRTDPHHARPGMGPGGGARPLQFARNAHVRVPADEHALRGADGGQSILPVRRIQGPGLPGRVLSRPDHQHPLPRNARRHHPQQRPHRGQAPRLRLRPHQCLLYRHPGHPFLRHHGDDGHEHLGERAGCHQRHVRFA